LYAAGAIGKHGNTQSEACNGNVYEVILTIFKKIFLINYGHPNL